MTYTFKAQKEIAIDCHNSGITFHQKSEWSRVPKLIEALEVIL